MKKTLKNKIKIIIVIVAIFLPSSAFAANVYLETARTEIFVGDTILINVKVDSEDKEINTVEGNVYLNYLPDTVLIKDLSLSQSSFSLWPNKPLLSDDLKTISFVGGVPNGLNSSDATLFKIVLNLKNVGSVRVSPLNISVYLNNGKGTKDTVSGQNLTLNVLPQKEGQQPIDEWGSLVSEDKIAPLAFEIIAGQDSSVFEGKKFLSFHTIDEQSGIKYYEVREGDLPPIRSSGTYVLQDQVKAGTVVVTAFDASGNFREATYNPQAPSFSNTALIVIVVVLLLLVLIVVVAVFKKRKKNEFISKQ